MTDSLTHSDSIFIRASAEEVYAVVSDVTRMGEFSPVCKACWWDEGEPGSVGAFFIGRNVTPERTWEVRCRVIVAEPGRAFGWTVGEGKVNWIYRMRPVEGGTELSESWELTPKGLAFFAERDGDAAPEVIENHRLAAETGIPATLAAMKRVIEAD